MPPPRAWDEALVAEGAAQLAAVDPVMGRLIAAVGACTLRPEPDLFPLLVRVIITQQISMKAAKTVAERLRKSLPARRFTPGGLAKRSVEDIMAAGMTRARATYIKGVAEAVAGRKLLLNALPAMSDPEVYAALTALHGLGKWTAEMVLIFGLGRADVFPPGDLGVRNAIGELYHAGVAPGPNECLEFADRWRPYRTLATWYLWRHADAKAQFTEGLSGYPV